MFQVHGGMKEDAMMELLESGLKNDNNPENFNLKHQLNRQYFPCRFIKVVPIQSWGPSFNFSIWHIALWGDDNPEVVKTAPDWHDRFRVGGGDDTAVPQTFQTTQLLRWGRLAFFGP